MPEASIRNKLLSLETYGGSTVSRAEFLDIVKYEAGTDLHSGQMERWLCDKMEKTFHWDGFPFPRTTQWEEFDDMFSMLGLFRFLELGCCEYIPVRYLHLFGRMVERWKRERWANLEGSGLKGESWTLVDKEVVEDGAS